MCEHEHQSHHSEKNGEWVPIPSSLALCKFIMIVENAHSNWVHETNFAFSSNPNLHSLWQSTTKCSSSFLQNVYCKHTNCIRCFQRLIFFYSLVSIYRAFKKSDELFACDFDISSILALSTNDIFSFGCISVYFSQFAFDVVSQILIDDVERCLCDGFAKWNTALIKLLTVSIERRYLFEPAVSLNHTIAQTLN